MMTTVRTLILLVFGMLSLFTSISGSSEVCETPQCPDNIGEIATCKHKCGLARDIPCSCDTRCVALGNCCEYFTETCPGLAERGKHQFASLINSRVICSRTSNVLQIVSCPGSIQGSVNRDKHSGFGQMGVWSESIQGGLEGALNNAPITDTSTGITFLNKDIFDCHVTSTSDTNWLPWDIQMEVLKFKNPTSMRLMEEVSDLASLLYQPRDEIERVLDGSRCLPQAIADCDKQQNEARPDRGEQVQEGDYSQLDRQVSNETWLPLNKPRRKDDTKPDLSRQVQNYSHNKTGGDENDTIPNLDELCRGPISYVASFVRDVESDYTDYYKNRFCYECNENNKNFYWPVVKINTLKHSFGLSILMSITVKGRISAQIKYDGWIHSNPPWKRAYCIPRTLTDKQPMNRTTGQMGANNQEENGEANKHAQNKQLTVRQRAQTEESELQENREDKQMKCVIESCDIGFSLRQGGKCKTKAGAKIAVSDDGFPLTADEVTHLPQFVGCILTNHVGQEVIKINQSVKVAMGGNINIGIPDKRLYVVSFDIYVQAKDNDLVDNLDMKTELFVLFDVLGAFRLHRKDRKENLKLSRPRQDIHIRQAELPYFTVFDLRYRYPGIKTSRNDAREFKGHTSTTTICFNSPGNNVLICQEDSVGKDTVRRYKNSPCFQVFESTKSRSRGSDMNSITPPLVCLILAVELLCNQ